MMSVLNGLELRTLIFMLVIGHLVPRNRVPFCYAEVFSERYSTATPCRVSAMWFSL